MTETNITLQEVSDDTDIRYGFFSPIEDLDKFEPGYSGTMGPSITTIRNFSFTENKSEGFDCFMV